MKDSTTFFGNIEKKLLFADMTTMSGEVCENICTADAQPRLCRSHTLPDTQNMTFNNFGISGDVSNRFVLYDAMAEFYKNSLYAGEPCVPDIIVCRSGISVPGSMPLSMCDSTAPLPVLKVLRWEHDAWFLFSSRFGFLSDKWWHIYGFISNIPKL